MENNPKKTSTVRCCTAFDGAARIAQGSYLDVALRIKDYGRRNTTASVLVFDDETGAQIDFDLSGSGAEISERLRKQFPSGPQESTRSPGRPKLGVEAREVTLLPRHWEWLAEQPGGASAALRRLVEEALRAGLSDKELMRKLNERAYRFMSAMAGNYPRFEDASRALFANDAVNLKRLISEWPADVREYLLKLWALDENNAARLPSAH